MAIYAVIAAKASPKLAANIAAQYPGEDHYELAPGQWLISTDKQLAKTVSDDLEIIGGGIGAQALVVRITGRPWGWHKKELWDWADAKGKGDA